MEEEDKSQISPSEIVEKKDVHSKVHQAIQELPEEYRVALVLKDLEDLSYEDICEILEIPKGTVKSRIHRAREALREKLKDLVK